MPGVGFHYWNDARNKAGGLVGIGPDPNQYNGFLDVFSTKPTVFYCFDYPEVFALPHNSSSLSGLFSSVLLPDTIFVQLRSQNPNVTSLINLVTTDSRSSIVLSADQVTFLNPVTGANTQIFPVVLDRNFLCNGNLDVWQRGVSFPASVGYTADRWRFNPNGSAVTAVQILAGLSGSNFAVRLQRPNLNANTNTVFLEQGGESVDSTRLRGEFLSTTFWYRGGPDYSGGGETVSLFSGTGTDEPSPNAYTGRSLVSSVSVSPTGVWQQAFMGGGVPGGCNELGLTLTKSSSGTAGAGDYVDYAQLQVGSSGVEDQGLALSRCQRYFQRFNQSGALFGKIGLGQAVSATTAIISVRLCPDMRVPPAPTQKGNLDIRSATNTFLPVTGLSPGFVTTRIAELDITVAAGMVGGNAATLEANNDATGDVFFDAEL